MDGALKEKRMAAGRNADRRLALALEQARDHLGGTRNGTTTQVVEIELDEISAIRRKVALSQESFARKLGISVATLRNWEQGRRRPTGPARRLLDLIDKRPDVLSEIQAAK